ncbi:amino acid adenylation domain-containing protein [Streptomyces hygroscopicus]|uniref:amino acid adenylation domain-containing protein n=1 Tax=Streptomyces hygroscopicus TaxID=1912 RepID=UPI003F1B9BC4
MNQHKAATVAKVAETVLRIAADTLPTGPEPSLDKPLKDYGMASLAATRMLLEIQVELGVAVPLEWLGGQVTLRRLIDHVAGLAASEGAADPDGGADAAAPDDGTGPGHRHEPFPLTPVQQAYVVGRDPDLTPDPSGCQLYREFAPPGVGQEDAARLADAWRALVAHQEALRLVVDDSGRQRVREDPPPVDVPVHDLTAAAPADYARHVREVRERLVRTVHRPGAWPMHAVEISQGPDETLVHLAIDGMLTDGHGLGVLLDQWWDRYKHPGRPLPPAPVPLRDAVLALHARRSTDAHGADLAHWRGRLAGMPPGPAVTAARPDPRPDGHPRRPLDAVLTPAQWRTLKERAARLDVTPTALVLTAFTEVLARYAGPGPFSLLLTTSDRVRLPRGTDGLAGPFTSTLLFPAAPSFDGSFDEAARAVHTRLWQDLQHAGVTGVEVLRALRSGGGQAPDMPPVVFTSLLDSATGGADGLMPHLVHTRGRTAGVALDHQMWEFRGALHYHWDVADGLLVPGAADVLFTALGNTLRDLASPDGAAQESRPLNELQKAYYVARFREPSAWEGCQVLFEFEVPDLDTRRLEDVWHAMTERYDVLRSHLSHDGELRVRREAGPRRRIPVVECGGPAERAAVRAALRERMATRAFPLGRRPLFDLCVVRGGDGDPAVYCAIDLAVADGRSLHLLVRELMAGCAGTGPWRPALPGGGPHPVGVPAAHSDEDRAASAAYWRERFAGMPAGPPTTAAPDRRRTRRSGTLSGWRRVRQAAERAGLSPDAVLLAALTEALSARVAEDFTVAAVRWLPGGDDLRPGEYTRLGWVSRGPAGARPAERAAAFQRQFDEDDRRGAAADGLAELRRVVMKERAAADFGFPVVHTGLLELTDHAPPAGVRPGEWMTCTPDVSLDSICVEEGDALHYHWDCVDADFPPGDADAMFAAYERSLAGLGDELAGERAGSAPRQDLAARERELVLHTWNDTAVPLPDERPAHHFFEDRARERPDAVAVVHAGGSVTYGELDRRANGIAWSLRSLGVTRGTTVGVSLRRGPEMIAAVLGVLKAGGAYVPIEPSLAAERAAGMLADTRAGVLLTTSDTRRPPAPAGVRTVEVDRDTEPSGAAPEPTADADSVAYVIFTSGSTGRPKGVTVAHRSLRNLLNWAWRTFDLGPGDMGLMVTSLGFDLSVFDIFGLLGRGAAVYVADEEQQRDPSELLDILLAEPVTFWNSAPTTLAQLMPLLPARAADRPGTEDLRLVFLSGDYTPLSLPDDLRTVFRSAELVSLGGATEATVWSNYHRVGKVDPDWRSIPYGRPIDNARYYILDGDRQPCPIGVEGDLYIGGDCLALGYHNQPGLTAERFVPDPFAGRPGQRMYDTGDRAAYGPDGVITFLGRSDTQVKIRGFRVELGEIEHRLRGHPGVKDTVVLARADAAGDRKVVAYVLPDGEAPRARELRSYASRTLPDYMVPNHVVFLDTFPATPNGKLDRDALPWPLPGRDGDGSVAGDGPASAAAELPDRGQETPPPGEQQEAGRQEAERLAGEIADIAADLLGGPVDPARDLWDQGATSFTMVRISHTLQQRHGVRIPVSALVDAPTAHGIARRLAAELDGSVPANAPETALAPNSPAPPAPFAPPAPSAPSAPEALAHVDLLDPQALAAFKAARWNLRPDDPGEPVVALAPAAPPTRDYTGRTTRRAFAGGPLPHGVFSGFLALLRTAHVDGRERRTYPSAGDTYAVQTYLHVRPGAVESVPAGLYYYDPLRHALRLIEANPSIDRTVHFVYNRPVFDEAAFEVYLIGQTKGIVPLYGPDGERFLHLEAGYLGQALMAAQETTGVGLCPVGSMAFDSVRDRLRLDEGHRFLQSFLCGPLADAGRKAPAGAGTAVIGVSGRYPGAATLDAFWDNLSEGRRSVAPAPAARADTVGTTPGGYLEDIDAFDHELFRISPHEARALDPQLRLLLHAVWECLEDAGHTPRSLRQAAPRTGVFVATMWNDHQHVGADRWERTGTAEISGVASDIPNRISHFFGFRGPSIAVNTSCSSSLTALHLAVESLRRGECDAAVVGAANLVAHPYHTAVLRGLGLVAPDGVTGAFDGAAGGWSPGEGVGVLLLRRTEDARRGLDHVHGVIESTWVDFAGGSDRFGAPDASALRDSMARALDGARIRPDDISYVECAATGAALSDAAEMEALGELFRGRAGDPVTVGTLKPVIGHLESASAMAQLTKTLLQMRHQCVAPTPLAERRSPLVAWEELPVRVADRRTPWLPPGPGEPLRALVTAVGATGSLAHAVVRSPVAGDLPPRDGETPDGPLVAVLSAPDQDRLRQAAYQLRDHLEARAADGGAPDPAAIAYTLQTGRVHHAHRLALPYDDTAALRRALDAWLEGRGCPAPDAGPVTRWLAGEEVDWARLWTRPARRTPLPVRVLAAGDPATGSAEPSAGPATPAPPDGERERVEQTERRLVELYAEVSGIPAARLDPRARLDGYGLTSYLVARLNVRVREEFPGAPATLFFEQRTLRGAAERLAALAGPAPAPTGADASAGSRAVTDVAVIGLGGRYPRAADLREFWNRLAAGEDCVRGLPGGRRTGRPQEHLMQGGFLDDVDRFDPLLFGIAPKDADLMDPQERLFLEVVRETLEDAGYPRERLRRAHDARVGVYVGSMHNEYPYLGVERTLAGQPVATGGTPAGIANRVSYYLDAQGPSMTVDTMCSSSLTALHLAVEALRRGECRVALAGGVNLSLHPNKFVQQRAMGMTPSDYRCRGFGAGGDGFAPAEGAGAVLLKPLDRAVADGDRILGVIKGTAVGHGGRTNGYTVPDPAAQARVVAEALRAAGVAPGTIGYVEAHGTGTALGDPVEIAGLDMVYAGLPSGSVPIGTVKSNIGHPEAAAGIAGLTKVLLQMRHGRFAPSLHTEELNPRIDWAASPFRVQREAADWPRPAGVPRRAGISSFGAGGSNAHVVVEEYAEEERMGQHAACGEEPERERRQPVVLSARTEEALGLLVERTAGWLRELPEGGDGVTLADVAYTCQVGREPLRERLALVVSSLPELAERLEAFLAGRGGGVLRGRAAGPDAHGAPAEERDPRGREAEEIARAWVDGAAWDWAAWHTGRRRIVPLPTYPYARHRCWLPEIEAGAEAERGPEAERRPLPDPAVRGTGVPLLERVWEAREAPEPPSGGEAHGVVVVLVGEGTEALGREAAAALGTGRTLLLREGGEAHEGITAFHDPAGAVRAVAGLRDVRGVLDLTDVGRPYDDPGPWQARLALLQELIRATDGRRLRLLLVTQGLQDPPGVRPSMAGARMAAFVRMLGAEYPGISATHLDTDLPTPGRVAAEWHAGDAFAEVCHRGTARLVARSAPVSGGAGGKGAAPLTADPDRTYLVTGGTRGLGSLVARRLVARGARRIVLTSLSGLPDRADWDSPALTPAQREAVRTVRALEREGARVAVHGGPLTDRAALAAFLDGVRTEFGPVGGVVHCAGTGTRGPAPFARKGLDDIRAVLEPKAEGLETLAGLCEEDRPSFFVVFSSVSSALPRLAAGMSDYAAANAYADSVVRHQVRLGRPWFRAVQWPVWEGGSAGPAARAACAREGIGTLTADEGLALLERIATLPGPAVVMPAPRPGPEDPAGNPEAGNPADAPAVAAAGARARAAEVGKRGADVEASTGEALDVRQVPDWLAGLFETTVGVPRSELDPAVSFHDLGIGSVMLAELVVGIERRTGRPMEPTALFEHSTLERLAAYLADQFGPLPEPERSPAPDAPPASNALSASGPLPTPDQLPDSGPRAGSRVPPGPRVAPEGDMAGGVAVIGMACRFPGAPDLDSYWKLLTSGTVAVGDVPAERWDTARLYRPEPAPGHSVSRWGGFVEGLEDFDADWFGMTGEEATCLDPAVRLFLEGVATALRDAGYREDELAGRPVGVFAGARMSGYRRRAGARGGAAQLGGDQNFIAAWASHHYDLRGPAMVVDSACSSALVGVRLACRSLLEGESELALAGAVEVLLDEEPYLEFSAAGALSPSGRCRTFDERADGFVPGEGCGVLLLKRLDAALRDGDRVHAVIEAVAVNNDGRTMGLTTPNPRAQSAVVRSALAEAGLRATDIGMVEAHGTATVIGDPIELRALSDVFRESTDRTGFCAIGSVKSNVGHLLSAAGIAGLVKAVLAVEHGTIPPTAGCERPNPRLGLESSPFSVQTDPLPWSTRGRRLAGVSAFGLGGTNAHAIVGEPYPGWRDDHRPVRRPLPAPEFRRRRYWLDREPDPVASILRLSFADGGGTAQRPMRRGTRR